MRRTYRPLWRYSPVLLSATLLCACAQGGTTTNPGSFLDAGDEPPNNNNSLDGALAQDDAGSSTSQPDSQVPCGSLDCASLSGPCSIGRCDEITNTCITEPLADGTACSDGDACTAGDTCQEGRCVSTSIVDCSGMDSSCAVGTCDPATGRCGSAPRPDGNACDDENGCTTDDRCTAGTCTGTPLDCSAVADMCNTTSCDESAGMCTPLPVPDGTSCDDGNAETTDDQCQSGVCRGTGSCRWLLLSEASQLDDTNIRTLLTSNGFEFTVQNNNGSSGTYSSDTRALSGYTHLIFHHTNRAITAGENSTLTAWLNAGGRMIATGYDTMGSPTDSSFAAIMGCTSPGDGPFGSALSVTDASHPIMMGPFQTFTSSTTLSASSTDHDQCTPASDATRLVGVTSSSSTGSTSSKLQIRSGVGSGNGIAVYWNGNGSISAAPSDWTGSSGTQPALQNLLLNTMHHLCNTP